MPCSSFCSFRLESTAVVVPKAGRVDPDPDPAPRTSDAASGFRVDPATLSVINTVNGAAKKRVPLCQLHCRLPCCLSMLYSLRGGLAKGAQAGRLRGWCTPGSPLRRCGWRLLVFQKRLRLLRLEEEVKAECWGG